MISRARKPLRTIIIGLGLFAGITSAQAQLLITFREDSQNGHLSILFSGKAATPFNVTNSVNSPSNTFVKDYAFSLDGSPTNPAYTSAVENWSSPDSLPLTAAYSSPVFTSGTGGIYRTTSTLQLASAAFAVAGNLITWDGILTYVGDLAGIGLSEGDSGTLVFSNGTDTFTINWDTAITPVPEPATYAAVLGLGIAGVALYRRRTTRR